MSCAACSARVEKAVKGLDGVTSCYVNLLTGDLGVEGAAAEKDIISAVEKAGYGIYTENSSQKTPQTTKDALKDTSTPALLKRFSVSLVILLPLMYISMGHTMWGLPLPSFFEGNYVAVGLAQLLMTAAVMLINQKFFVNGIKGLFHGAPNMDTLVAIGSGASFIYSTWALFEMSASVLHGNGELALQYLHELYFEGAAMILTLITLGKTLESYSKGKTTNAIRSLMELAPQTANVINDGKEIKISAELLNKGDIFAVYPGEKIPADATVLEGGCAVDESALTGESLPVDKLPGDRVSAATINKSGFIKCRAEGVGDDTSLAQIIKMVSDASSEKAPIAKAADKVSGVFVPVVMTLALITASVWLILGESVGFALARAVSVLVISCPCALGLATPVAIMVGSGIGAKCGILFKTAEALEETGKIKTVVLDKTGTLTKGEPRVTDVITFNCSEERLLSLAACVESKSEHPLAKAVVLWAESKGIAARDSDSFQALSGKGVSSSLDGKLIRGGSLDFISSAVSVPKEAVDEAALLSAQGKTPLFFSEASSFVGIIAVADTLKKDSAAAVKALSQLGLKVVMLTGDNEKTAEAIGRAAGVDRIIAGVLPDGKERVIRELKSDGKVAMVGDGINDAPALTSADIGIAIGRGTDVAIDAADVVLMKSSVYDVVKAVTLSRKVLRNIRENLFWAFFYNSVGIPVAAGVLIKAFGIGLSPMLAAGAMSLSSFFVVSNALRLNLFRRKLKKDAPELPSHSEEDCPETKLILPDGVRSVSLGASEDSDTTEKNNDHNINKEINTMTKTMNIEGMMCPHCEARVKKCLEELDGVLEAVPSHESNTAVITLEKDVSDLILKEAVEKQGYTVL